MCTEQMLTKICENFKHPETYKYTYQKYYKLICDVSENVFKKITISY
jgi:hypothetical protein